MGTTRSIPLVVTMVLDRGMATPAEWRTRARGSAPSFGKPTAANLAAYVKAFEDSTAPDGCNAHIGPRRVISAKIVRQATHEILATYAAG